MHPDRGKTVWLFYASSFCDFSLTFLRFFFLGPTGLKARPLLYCLWALQPPNLVLILQHTGFKIISEGYSYFKAVLRQANVQPQFRFHALKKVSVIGAEKINRTLNNFWLWVYFGVKFMLLLNPPYVVASSEDWWGSFKILPEILWLIQHQKLKILMVDFFGKN